MLLSIFMFSASMVNAQKGNGSFNGPNSKQQGLENAIPDLTEQQKAEIKTLRIKHMKEAQGIKDLIDVKRAELKVLQNAEKSDIDAINKKIEEKAKLRTNLEKSNATFILAVKNILTDEQKVIFDQKMSHMKGQHKGAHNGKGHGNKDCNGSKGGHGKKLNCKN